ncbi:phage major capsid protein [Peribacillus frigoritolerans]|uniref:phage major capsid protein n=1 Tax=Peribacillus frigoritolerans TaxID=450367 RepID=UPI00207A2242|nr:phage major capsid protein [Peribacillus frigoritolerans]USK78962.1 phage major capsid protein [Peribacillus frigoritolerans]
MNKKLREMKASIEAKKVEMRKLLDEKKVDEAKAMTGELKTLQDAFDVEFELAETEKGEIEVKNQSKKGEASIEAQAFKNFVNRKSLTEDMKNALKTSPNEDGGALVPVELVEVLVEAKKQLVSLKDFVQVIPVSAPSGSVPVAEGDNGALIDFTEMTDLTEASQKFRSVAYSAKSKGCITPVSNQLLKDAVFGIPAIVTNDFAKRATRSENADILTEAKAGKTAVQITNIAGLKKSINVDIDPAAKLDGVIIMNQDAYDKFDNEVDTNGRPLLSSSVQDADVKTFKGLQVVVLSNAELPTTGTTTKKAPIFYGSLKGILFFDKGEYEVAVSDAAGFRQNATLMRVIERYDVKGGAKEDYVYAELTI